MVSGFHGWQCTYVLVVVSKVIHRIVKRNNSNSLTMKTYVTNYSSLLVEISPQSS